jgi:hypothetical protein
MSEKSQDNRRTPRTAVLGHVKIVTHEGGINCVVRDLSDIGANLAFLAMQGSRTNSSCGLSGATSGSKPV